MNTRADELVTKYYDLVWRICYTRLWRYDRVGVDDAAQNVFLSYVRAAPYLKTEAAERAYFVRAAVNASNEIYRRLRRTREHQVDDALDSAMLVPAEEYDPTYGAVWDAIASLPAHYRAVIELCCISGYSSNETAKLLGCSDTAVRMRLSRARKALRKKFIQGGILDEKEFIE